MPFAASGCNQGGPPRLLPRREEREKRRRVLAFYVGSSLSGFGLYRLAEHRDNRRCREAVD